MKNLFGILSVIILVSACQTAKTEFAKEIEVLDSLKSDLAEIKSSFEQFDLKKLRMIDSIATEHARVLNEGIQDTLKRDEWMVLGNFTRTINKRLNKFEPKLNKLKSEVDTSLKKVDDLIVDLEHNSWTREQALEYMKTETEKCAELVAANELLKEHAAMAMETFHEDHARVDSLMTKINERMNKVLQN